MEWPEWWAWGLAFPPHLDRFVIEVRHASRRWEVIVEPVPWEQRLLVITAYRVDG
jgi:hypothetical protein